MVATSSSRMTCGFWILSDYSDCRLLLLSCSSARLCCHARRSTLQLVHARAISKQNNDTHTGMHPCKALPGHIMQDIVISVILRKNVQTYAVTDLPANLQFHTSEVSHPPSSNDTPDSMQQPPMFRAIILRRLHGVFFDRPR